MLIFFLLPKASIENISNLVKIILLKSDNCALALQKRLFCVAKQQVLQYADKEIVKQQKYL